MFQSNRSDSEDILVWRRGQGLLNLGGLNDPDAEDMNPRITGDGNLIVFHSDRNGNADIYLYDISVQSFTELPGLNTPFEESVPAVSANAEYILFHSKRPGGEGGYDLYLYHREDGKKLTAPESYTVKGNVSGAGANESINILDASGNVIDIAKTDALGNFSIDIPEDTELPVRLESDAGTVVITGPDELTDEVGNDTYVPDFEAGNLKFTDVWIPDVAQAGFPMEIWFDIMADVPKYNVYVSLGLKRITQGNVSDIDPTTEGFKADYGVGAVVIEKLARGEKQHVTTTFTMPPDVVNGTYAAVFSINDYDFFPDDNALQGEENLDKKDNFMVAPASIIIGKPDLPNLRILYANLSNNSFILPNTRPEDVQSVFSGSPLLNLSLEVESMAQDIAGPVEIGFYLNIPEVGTYPLFLPALDQTGENIVKADKWVYQSMTRQEPLGHTFDLYLNDVAYDALAGSTEDVSCTLTIKVDPENKIREWEDNKADNIRDMPVILLSGMKEDGTDRRNASARSDYNGPYSNPIFNTYDNRWFGNNTIGAGYNLGSELNYKTVDIKGHQFPIAGYFGSENWIRAKIGGNTLHLYDLWLKTDVNIDNITGSYFSFGASIAGIRIWGNTFSMIADHYGNLGEMVLFSTNFMGNELYSKSMPIPPPGTPGIPIGAIPIVPPIPISVNIAVTGTVGIKGSVSVAANNQLILRLGPSASLEASVEIGLGLSDIIELGIGGSLKLIEVYQQFSPSIQIRPSVPEAIFRFEAPFEISTLDGSIYAYATLLVVSFQIPIIEWSGLAWQLTWSQPLEHRWSSDWNKIITNANTRTDYKKPPDDDDDPPDDDDDPSDDDD